jgi:hypothetical protein
MNGVKLASASCDKFDKVRLSQNVPDGTYELASEFSQNTVKI